MNNVASSTKITFPLSDTKQKINTNQETDNTVNSMVNDSDLIVLQENYTYLLWSILAVGIFTVTLSKINK